MPPFLSNDWLAELAKAAEEFSAAGRPVTIQQVIRDTPKGDVEDHKGNVEYYLDFDEQSLRIVPGLSARADVAISQDYETAKALHDGTLSIRDAFFDGRIKVKGNLNALLDNTERLAAANELLSS